MISLSLYAQKLTVGMVVFHDAYRQGVQSLVDYDDEALASNVSKGNHHAFAILVKRHNLRFYRLAYRYLLDQAEAEDLVQECYLKFWQKPEMWQSNRQAKFTTWFSKVLINACLDRHRQKKAYALMDGDLQHWDMQQAQQQLDDVDLEVQSAQLHQAMKSLPSRQRMAVNLVYFEQMSNQGAAEAMDIRLKALQSLVMRAKGHLKEYFARDKEG